MAAARRPAPAPPAAAAPTRFGRTRRTAEIALGGRVLPYGEEPRFDDVDIGELDGALTADYRTWKRAHTRRDRFPGGESLVEAAERYAAGFELEAAVEVELDEPRDVGNREGRWMAWLVRMMWLPR